MTCPFCGAELVSTAERDLGEGESGGLARTSELHCPTCTAAITVTRVDKIGAAEERWLLASPPNAERVAPTPPSSAGETPCAKCGGATRGAMARGHVPRPGYAIDQTPARVRVSVDTYCRTCGAIGHCSYG